MCLLRPNGTQGLLAWATPDKIHEAARQRARDLANTPAFARSQHRKVEALFAEAQEPDRTQTAYACDAIREPVDRRARTVNPVASNVSSRSVA
jgi:hypothetical protein